MKEGSLYTDGVSAGLSEFAPFLFEENFHEPEIREAILAINHYRFPSKDILDIKCKRTHNKRQEGYGTNVSECVRDAMEIGIVREVKDTVLKTKMHLRRNGMECSKHLPLHQAINMDTSCDQHDKCCWVNLPVASSEWKSNFSHRSHFYSVSSFHLPTLKHLALGQGTTATHAVHEEFCKEGLRALHWIRNCNFSPLQKNNLVVYRNLLKEYVANPGTSAEEAATKEVALIESLRVLEVEAFSDSGLLNFAESVVSANKHTNIILTHRRADEWASKRVADHGRTLICSPPWYSLEDPFQYTACLLSRMETQQPFVTVEELYRMPIIQDGMAAGMSGKDALSLAFILHNNLMVSLAPKKTTVKCYFGRTN